MTTKRIVSLAAVAAIGLTLTACSDDESSGSSGDDGATQEQTEDSAEDSAAEDTGADEGAGSSDTDAVADCLIGSWEMTADALQEQALLQAGEGAEVSVEGDNQLTFEADTVTQVLDTSSTSTVTLEGTTTETVTESHGTYTVTYTLEGDTITYGEVVEAEGSGSFTVNGNTQEVEFAEVAAQLAGQSETVTSCTDSELVLTVSIGTASLDKVLTRA